MMDACLLVQGLGKLRALVMVVVCLMWGWFGVADSRKGSHAHQLERDPADTRPEEDISVAPSAAGADNPDRADSSSRLQTEAFTAAWLAVLPSLTMAQLLKHMEPSQPALVKVAAARELARRLQAAGRELSEEEQDEEEQEALSAEANAFQACREGVSRLVQLLTEAEEHNTQLAALVALRAVWKWCSNDFLRQQLAQQLGFAYTVVWLLHELTAVGDEDMQAELIESVAHLLQNTGECPQALGPSPSNLNSWPMASAFVAVLQSPAVSSKCEGWAAAALYWLVSGQPSAAEHPAVQAAVGPLVALLQNKDDGVCEQAAHAIRKLAEGRPANQSLIGAEPGAINRLWQLTCCDNPPLNIADALAAVVKGHRVNQASLIAQDGFVDKLLDLLAGQQDLWAFSNVAAALSQDNPEFILRLCNTPTAVPLLTGALRPTSALGNEVILALLLSMCKAPCSTIHTIRSQPGVADKLQELSGAKDDDGKQEYPDATSLLQLARGAAAEVRWPRGKAAAVGVQCGTPGGMLGQM